jgi:hypothetical protein
MKNFIVIAVLTVAFASACTKKTEQATDAGQAANTAAQPAAGTTAQTAAAPGAAATEPKVESVDSVVGKGAEAVTGKSVTVHYTGTLKDGTKFDSSVDRKEPFTFALGAGQVIKGWEQGIVGMKVGGKRKLTIPAELAYGANAVGAIPANSTLIFEVELLEVK